MWGYIFEERLHDIKEMSREEEAIRHHYHYHHLRYHSTTTHDPAVNTSLQSLFEDWWSVIHTTHRAGKRHIASVVAGGLC